MKGTISGVGKYLKINGNIISIESKYSDEKTISFNLDDIIDIEWNPKQTWLEKANIYFNVEDRRRKRIRIIGISSDPYCVHFENFQVDEVNHLFNYITKNKSNKNSKKEEYSKKFKNDTNEKTSSNGIGCFSFLIRVAFIIFYWLFPTYDTTFANTLSEELNSIQFWIGFLGALLISYFFSRILVPEFVEREINSKYGLIAIFLLNFVCWIFLPNLLIDWSGEIVMNIIKKLFN